MDPDLFHLDWSESVKVLTAIIVLSFVERALAVLFESRFVIKRFTNSENIC